MFLYIALFLSFFGVVFGNIYYKNQLQSACKKGTLQEKLTHYISISIVKFAFLDGAALFSIVCIMLTDSYYFVVIALFLLAILILNRPTEPKAKFELQLTDEEFNQLL